MLGGVVAAQTIHENLLDQILHAPMSFFDTTPLGRIVNRFSTDMDKLDSTIPLFTRFWFFQVATMIATIVLISYSTPIFLSVMLPMVILYGFIQVRKTAVAIQYVCSASPLPLKIRSPPLHGYNNCPSS